jgi:hypothetical protein
MMDSRELPTRFVNAQQMSAKVSAGLIANPGGKQVILQTSDGKAFSNSLPFNIQPPPTPNISFVGIIGTPQHLDTAIIQDKGSKDLQNAQRGDVVGGRFRITSISQKELVLVDTNLKIKHTIPFSTDTPKGFNPTQRSVPRVSEDDEP